ncbi:ADP-heptose--LPS heptosyltransferase 2 [Dyadobacter sp. CECT 9623]|uniref:ADP-heptose--LPS heptosyltransferase 2 n=1 Tax=Dyadobacter linearis TaxID=2823330 RepID=A0ABN7R5L4_9BACT|nr:glycosyltransferase family 9 protein [Dyadobacter sp. CECT 9623]CAG5067592.1 ADP-heptose--LPS heptosyltransferase 2 [Dyadobacter sp. CECT 9623]
MKFSVATTRKIAVFRALQLGDMFCSVPALRALRHSYPNAEITLLGLPWASSFCARFSNYIDRFIHFPGYEGLPEQVVDEHSWNAFKTQMQVEAFDLILQMQGNGNIVNDMLENLGAGPVAGFHSKGNYRNSDHFLEYPTGISEIERHLKMLENLGIPSQGTELEFPVSESEAKHLHESVSFLQGERFVCIHPGSRGSWRQWPPLHFACAADICAGKGYKVVVTGTKEEAAITSEVLELMEYPALDLTGKTGLGEIAQLLKESKLLISNCTGVSHIAAATRTPSIVISMDGEPERWGPLNTTLHKTVDWLREPDMDYVLASLNSLLPDLTNK